MADILIRAGCFIAIIALGYILKRIGVFKEDDFKILSKVIIKISLPAVIIVNFAGSEISLSMIPILFLGIGCGAVYMVIAVIKSIRKSREQAAFEVMNLSSYNIGNFTLPFVQSFLGPTGVIVTSLFDAGNSVICLGGSFGIASAIKDGSGFSFKRIGAALVRSVPFMCYIIMFILNVAHVPLPGPILSLAKIIAGSNAFIAMLMIGIGFNLGSDKSQIGYIVKLLIIRFSVAAVFALVLYYLLPFSLEIRQTLVILVFSPVASAIPAFTGNLKGNVGLSSAVNSATILCSIVILTVLLTVMLG
ncbi:MAG: AEC family transporter [Oscillospiraceae bacterium]|nr:AEC family transporter [Oscillospiraceae bacterium]